VVLEPHDWSALENCFQPSNRGRKLPKSAPEGLPRLLCQWRKQAQSLLGQKLDGQRGEILCWSVIYSLLNFFYSFSRCESYAELATLNLRSDQNWNLYILLLHSVTYYELFIEIKLTNNFLKLEPVNLISLGWIEWKADWLFYLIQFIYFA